MPRPVEVGELARASAWRLGVAGIDDVLGVGLDPAGVHEIKPMLDHRVGLAEGGVRPGATVAAGWSAARAFALALAVRRLTGLDRRGAAGGAGAASPRLLWVATGAMVRETGALYGPGLARFGLAPHELVIAEPANARDVLWTIEEGLKSASLALVVGLLDAVPLTPARRLSLAAAEHRTPCLLLTHPRHPPAASTATRWRIAPAASPPPPCDTAAPGRTSLAVTLDRCRSALTAAEAHTFLLEWCDEAYAFRLAAPSGHRPARSRRAGGGTG